MADKFPSLTNLKQRIFSIDLARFAVAGEARAAAVVAERGRITLFWSRADASWDSLAREHDNLNLTPRRADDTASLGWTSRIGTAAADGQVALAYKRRFDASSAGDLWIDLFDFDAAEDRFRGGASPRRFPRRDFGIERFGFCVWADAAGGRLLIVTQAFLSDLPDAPRLVLLETPLPVSAAQTLEDAGVWTLTDLDAGGWDFAARREGTTLVVLHRRSAATYAADVTLFDPAFDPASRPITILLRENPALVPRTVTQMGIASLALVDVDLATTTVTSIDADLPFGENPQIHCVSPFIASVDSLVSGSIVLASDGFRVRRFRSRCHLLMRTSAGWRTSLLLGQRTDWPRHLSNFARIQQGIALQTVAGGVGVTLRVLWSALWTLRPIVLFKREAADKGTLLTFGHQDSDFGALRATTFRVFEDDGGDTLRAVAESFVLLDLGHRHIPEPANDGAEPIEHEQLRPHTIDARAAHADGPDIVRLEDSANTMNGELVAHVDRPAAFYAYTEMGDGGPRVVFDSDLELPPPTATADEKTFRPAWVAEPPRPGRAWVRLATPGFVDTQLPGYFVSPVALNPPSLACDQQRALDGLAFASDQLRAVDPVSPDDALTFAVPVLGDGLIRYREPPGVLAGALVEFMRVTEASAGDLQRFAVEQSEAVPLRPVRSASDQPFVIEIRQPRSLRFAGDTLQFDGVVIGAANQGDFQFDWTFPDGATATGRLVEHDFAPTLPDFSRINSGEVQDDIEVTLTVTAADGAVSTASVRFSLARSLWATLWTAYSAFRRAPDDVVDENGDWQISNDEWESFLAPGMFVRDVTLSFYRYALRYQVDEQGRGTGVEISNKRVHDGRFRFLGNAAGQGDVEYEVPLHAALTGVQLTGDFGGGLGTVIAINSVDVRFRCRQKFTIGVQTSEQRDRFAESETMRNQQLLRPVQMIPSALCCLPVGELTLEIDDDGLDVDSALTAAGWTLVILVSAVMAAVSASTVLLILLPLLLVVAPAAVAAGGTAAIVAAIVGAGFGALTALLIDVFIVRPTIKQTIRDALETPETRASFSESGLFTYAGEGLAESLAIKLMRQAQADGHAVADPGSNGRDRFRAPFFETIVVGDAECKAELRV